AVPLADVSFLHQDGQHPEYLVPRPPEAGRDLSHGHRFLAGGQQLYYFEAFLERGGLVDRLVLVGHVLDTCCGKPRIITDRPVRRSMRSDLVEHIFKYEIIKPGLRATALRSLPGTAAILRRDRTRE